MQGDVFVSGLWTGICVAVIAQVPASVIFADIDAGDAAAEFSLSFIFFNFHLPAGQFRNQTIIDASTVLNSVIGKISRFGTGLDFNVIGACDGGNLCGQRPYFNFIGRPDGAAGKFGL